MSTVEVPKIGDIGKKPEDLRTAPKDKKRPRRGHKRDLFGNIVLAGATLALGTGTATVADKIASDQGVKIPVLHDALESARDTVAQLILTKGPPLRETIEQIFGKSPEIPRSFNPNAEDGIAKGGWNTVSVPKEELPSLLKNTVKSSKEGSTIISLLFPAKLGNDERGIFHIGSGGYENSVGGMMLTLPKKGTDIVIPVEEAEVFQTPPWYVEGVPYFSGFVLRFNAPDGTQYEMTIKSQRDVRELIPTDIVKNAPFIGGGIRLKGGTVIASTGFEYAEINFHLTPKGQRKALLFSLITKEVDGISKIVTLK